MALPFPGVEDRSSSRDSHCREIADPLRRFVHADARWPFVNKAWTVSIRCCWLRSLSALLALLCLFAAPCALAADEDPKALYARANAARHAGRLDEAIAAFRQLCEAGDAPAALRRKAGYLIGLCYENQQRSDEAIAAYRQLITRFPDSAAARNARRQIQALSGQDHLRELKVQLAAIKLHEEGAYERSLAELARFQLPAGLDDPAFKALLADPDSRRGDLYALRGDNLYALRRYPEAARAYAQADALNVPGAAELARRARSYRYRAWLGRGAALALLGLLIALLRRAPWRAFTGPWRRPALRALAAMVAAWGALLLAFILVGQRLNIQDDLARPIDGAALALLFAVASPAAFAGLLFALTARRGTREIALSAAFALAALSASLICLFDRMDWFMLVGL